MISLNKVMLIGKIATEPKMKITKSGQRIVTFKVITASSWADKNNEIQSKPEWHSIAAFGKVADKVQESLHKESMVYIEGTIQSRKVPVPSISSDDLFKQVFEIRALDLMPLEASVINIPDNYGNTYDYEEEEEF